MNGISLLAYIVDSFLICILVLGVLVLIYMTFVICLFNPTLPAGPAASQPAGGVQLPTATSTDQMQPPLNSAARNMFTINIFGENNSNNNKPESKDDDPCAICLSGGRADLPEVWRVLPRCKHGFHVHCILKWLETNETCPICRDSVFSM